MAIEHASKNNVCVCVLFLWGECSMNGWNSSYTYIQAMLREAPVMGACVGPWVVHQKHGTWNMENMSHDRKRDVPIKTQCRKHEIFFHFFSSFEGNNNISAGCPIQVISRSEKDWAFCISAIGELFIRMCGQGLHFFYEDVLLITAMGYRWSREVNS